VRVDDPRDWLGAMSAAFLDFALEAPHQYEAAFHLRARTARQFPDDFTAGRSPPGAMVFARIEAAKAAGLLGDASTPEVTMSIWAMAQGLIDLYRAGRFAGGEADFRAFYDAALKRCIASFRPGAPS
jgi:hypothetical protein